MAEAGEVSATLVQGEIMTMVVKKTKKIVNKSSEEAVIKDGEGTGVEKVVKQKATIPKPRAPRKAKVEIVEKAV